MSGGSYDYLDTADLAPMLSSVERMADRLKQLGHDDAARRTADAAKALRDASAAQAELRAVWHAVEWLDSGDCTEEDVAEAVATLRREP